MYKNFIIENAEQQKLNKEERYLSKQIKYDRDIEPYRFIKIYAGVGAGKNVFVDNLIKGEKIKNTDGTIIEPKSVLLITSRRAKVDEQLNSDNVTYDPIIAVFDGLGGDWLMWQDDKYMDSLESPTIELPKLGSSKYTTVRKRSCVNSNAKIEHYLKEFKSCDATTHPWERFDIIVVDEVHALLADASYQSAPFYVRRLIEETFKHSDKCKVIVMTGTPEIIKNYDLIERAHLIDKMDDCVKVMPKRIEFITKKESKEKQEEFLKKNIKFITFFNHVEDIFDMEKEYADKVAVSFSKSNKVKELKTNRSKSYDKMIKTQKYLALNNKLPEDIIGFLSTSKNKEGINIKNDDIHYMFVESHIGIDIIQMAGRVRNKVDVLYIVVDSKPHLDFEDEYEAELSRYTKFISVIESKLYDLCLENGYNLWEDNIEELAWRKSIVKHEKLKKFIDYIHNKFPYIRFDYFDYRFKYYPDRLKSRKYYYSEDLKYKNAVQSSGTLKALTSEWFPNVPVHISKKVKLLKDTEAAVLDYLEGNGWANKGKVIRKEQIKEILNELNTITGNENKSLKPLLNKYGYDLVPANKSHNANRPFVIESIIKEKQAA